MKTAYPIRYTSEVSVHLPENWRHFVFPKTFLCFGVGLNFGLGLRLELAEINHTMKVTNQQHLYFAN